MFKKKLAAITAAAAVLVTAACSGGASGGASDDPDGAVTLNLAFWGNDVRAEMYDQAITAFNEEYPNITVNSSFLAFPEFYEKRQIEAASGGLPDVMQFDYSYLRQYSENGLLLDLAPYMGSTIQTDTFAEQALSIGVVGAETTALSIGTNTWSMFLNTDLLSQTGVEPYEGGGSWDDFGGWVSDVSTAADGEAWGASDWGVRIQNFELQLRGQGKDLFTEDGQPGFTEDDLREFWNQGAKLREAEAFVPASRLEEVYPMFGLGVGAGASELLFDNFGVTLLGDLGAEAEVLEVVAPPTVDPSAQDMYLHPSMMYSIAANSEHPEEAAILVNFLLNSEKVGEIFGTNQGTPASETRLAGVEMDELAQKVSDYEASIADRLGDPPPVPVIGYGSLEEKFRLIGSEIGLGTTSVDDAVTQYFSEMSAILGG
ncbi:MAG: ABC transporter substrate-binding protein [Arachnia sp.]